MNWSHGRVKPQITLVFTASPLSLQNYGARATTGWLRIVIMCFSAKLTGPWWGIWFDILKYNDNHFFNFKKHRVSFFYGFLSALFKLIYWKPILFKFGQDFNLTGFSASQENINKNIPGPIISRRIFSYWRCAKPVGRLQLLTKLRGHLGPWCEKV
jgi:hypothetical protein